MTMIEDLTASKVAYPFHGAQTCQGWTYNARWPQECTAVAKWKIALGVEKNHVFCTRHAHSIARSTEQAFHKFVAAVKS